VWEVVNVCVAAYFFVQFGFDTPEMKWRAVTYWPKLDTMARKKLKESKEALKYYKAGQRISR
jgi:hypothetical protein